MRLKKVSLPKTWADKAIVVYTFITYQSQYSYSPLVFIMVIWLYIVGWFLQLVDLSIQMWLLEHLAIIYKQIPSHDSLPAFTMATLSTTGNDYALGVIDAKSQDYVQARHVRKGFLEKCCVHYLP